MLHHFSCSSEESQGIIRKVPEDLRRLQIRVYKHSRPHRKRESLERDLEKAKKSEEIL